MSRHLRRARWQLAAAAVGVACAFLTLTVTGTYEVQREPRAPLVTFLPGPQPTLTPPPVGPTGAVVGAQLADARDGVAP